jgi:hypothetical protein
VSDKIKNSGQCHCGSVKFTVELLDGLSKPARCNCTMCRMKGAVMVFAKLGGIMVTGGEELLTTYQFHSKVAKHMFCSRCGIHLFHQRRLDPDQYGVNVAVLDGVSPFDFEQVAVFDGENHPKDHGGGAMGIAGTMQFERKQAGQ